MRRPGPTAAPFIRGSGGIGYNPSRATTARRLRRAARRRGERDAEEAEDNGMHPLTLTPLLALAIAATPALAAGPDPLREQAKGLFQPIPKTPPALPGNAGHPGEARARAGCSTSSRGSPRPTTSAATPATWSALGGADGRPTSIGHNWQLGGRNAPTVLNAVFNTAQFWDGRAADLEAAGRRADREPDRDGHHQGARGRAAQGHPGLRRRVQGRLPGRGRPDHL